MGDGIIELRKPNWFAEITNNPQEMDYLIGIFNFIYDKMSYSFGQNSMQSEKCMIIRQAEYECPMFVTHYNGLELPYPKIILKMNEYCCWAQLIYQLSHEMCHYVIRQNKVGKDVKIAWLEEILCEAYSLYMLRITAHKWVECDLSKINAGYALSINDYLARRLEKVGNPIDKNTTLAGFVIINEMCESQRENHAFERNLMYTLFITHPEQIQAIADYTNYIRENGLMIDFDEWLRDTNNNIIVKNLKEMCPYVLIYR